MQIFKVGGAVRDLLLGRQVNDVDWVVVGTTVEAMLSQAYQPVGTDFPVFLHPVTGDEYALARAERQDIGGDRLLAFHASPEVTLEEDLARRDLTINSMAEDQSGVIIDPYGGQADLDARLLRHIAPTFAEDPVRVLRVARFAARYAPLGFTVAPETMALMRNIAESGQLADQSAERMWKEIARALMEPRADVFIEVLRECGALKAVMPELDALFGVEQPAEHHPEIDTGVHVLMVLRQACRFEQPLSVRWAALTHDLGKGLSPVETLPAHYGHEGAGVNLVKAVNARFKVPTDCAYLAKAVCELHTNAHRAFDLRAKTLLGLMSRLDAFRRPGQLANFVAACEMDSRGRLGFEDRDYPQGEYILRAVDIAQAVQAKPYVENGLKGPAIGLAVREERLRRLHQYKESRKAVALAS
jgi:tRNA nucleotidyltransferase (CCA-adding enzyme)